MDKLYDWAARFYFFAATVALLALAGILLVIAVGEAAVGLLAGDPVNPILDSIALLIIGFAVIETAKFVAEEELLRRRELRSARESRRSLTKFITIIVIASSLEALVMVFKTSRDSIADAIYPAALFGASMLALVSLGLYQWLSSRIEQPSAREKEEEAAGADDDGGR